MQGNIVPSYTHTETLTRWVGWGGGLSVPPQKLAVKLWLYSPECTGSRSKNHLHNALNACRNLKRYRWNVHLFLKEQLTQKFIQNSFQSNLLTLMTFLQKVNFFKHILGNIIKANDKKHHKSLYFIIIIQSYLKSHNTFEGGIQ